MPKKIPIQGINKEDKNNDQKNNNINNNVKEDTFIKEFKNSLNKVKIIAEEVNADVELTPTYIKPLDYILGGGIGIGVATQISGDEGSSKTSLALQIIGNLQKVHGDNVLVIYLDSEAKVSRERAEKLGVDWDRVIYTKPENVEDVFTLVKSACNTMADKFSKNKDKFVLIVWDSLASTPSRRALESSLGQYDKMYSMHKASIISEALQTVLIPMKKNRVSLLVINQTRENMEQIPSFFGEKKKNNPGGKAVKFAYYHTLEMKVVKKDLDNHLQVVQIQTIKNNKTIPFVKVNCVFSFDTGYIDALSFLKFGTDEKVKALSKKQGIFYIEGTKNKIKFVELCLKHSNEPADSETSTTFKNIIQNQKQDQKINTILDSILEKFSYSFKLGKMFDFVSKYYSDTIFKSIINEFWDYLFYNFMKKAYVLRDIIYGGISFSSTEENPILDDNDSDNNDLE